jgi:hypothetical protein
MKARKLLVVAGDVAINDNVTKDLSAFSQCNMVQLLAICECPGCLPP